LLRYVLIDQSLIIEFILIFDLFDLSRYK